MTFDTGFLTSMTTITTIVLRNLNLKNQAEEVAELLPTSVADLTLVNMLMYTFPTAIANFSSLTTLYGFELVWQLHCKPLSCCHVMITQKDGQELHNICGS